MEESFKAAHLYNLDLHHCPRNSQTHEVGHSQSLCHKLYPSRNIYDEKILSSSLVGRVNPAEIPLQCLCSVLGPRVQSIHRWKGILDAGTWRVYNLLSDITTTRNDYCLMT